MAIIVLPDLEAEYVAKRDQVINYPPASIDDDLARLETLASVVNEAVLVLRAREEINGRPSNTESVRAIEDSSESVTRAAADVRTALASIQAAFAAFDTP